MAGPDDIRLSFNQVPEIYDRVRPGYPPALFDSLFQRLPDEPRIIEVGPGTGQATKDLLARGARVHGVEIGAAMGAKLRSNLETDRLEVSIADFETIDVRAASVDAVFSATAYHWISPGAQTDRPATLLRPGGIVAIVDLNQVESPDDDGFFAAATPIYARYGEGHSRHRPAPTREAVDPAIRSVFAADERFETVALDRYDWNQTYSASAYRDLMLSYSGTQMMAVDQRKGLLDDIEAMINSDFNGVVTRPLVVTLMAARRR